MSTFRDGKLVRDETLRIDYPLNDKSVVFDIGGFKGDWSDKIYNKYNSIVYIFEPIVDYVDTISDRFLGTDKVKIFEFGLSETEQEIEIFKDNDSSSIFGDGDEIEIIKLKNINSFIVKNDINVINLMKINIEGSEYGLLESMITNNTHTKIENIQVQFHRFIPDCINRRNKIHEELKKTHKLTYNFEFIWENWELKK